jgi:predicted membrane-bound spermidine synthase
VPLAALLVRRRPAAFTGPETLALGCFVGAAGMALQLLLLIAYQVRTGRLYVGYAVLTAAFMLGVAAGARLGDRLLRCRGWGPRPALVRLETLAAGALLALWAASAAVAASPPLLLAGTIVAGLLTGVPFPALVALARISGRSPARAGAWASAGDSLGALVGALAATLVLLPAHGYAAARAAGALTAAVRNA